MSVSECVYMHTNKSFFFFFFFPRRGGKNKQRNGKVELGWVGCWWLIEHSTKGLVDKSERQIN